MEQTLCNETVAANKSIEIAQKVNYAASNASCLLSVVNTETKALSVSYGIALTGASAIDAVGAKNSYSRCLFGLGCAFGATETVSSVITVFNLLLKLRPLAIVSNNVGLSYRFIGWVEKQMQLLKFLIFQHYNIIHFQKFKAHFKFLKMYFNY